MAEPCSFADSDKECYTASWILTKEQLLFWLTFQIPVIGVCIIYDWIDPSRSRRVEKLRVFLASTFVQVVNSGVQLIGSVYVCFVWISRGGSLSVDISSWGIESIFMIMMIISYIFRWLGAKNKTWFALQLYCVFDLLSISSHFAISFQTVRVDDRLKRSWLDFGFLRSYILYAYFGGLFKLVANKTYLSQIMWVVFQGACLIFFAACILFSFELLGEIPGSESFLLHVYDCTDENGVTIRTDSTSGYGPNDCSETWSLMSSVYFMFVTVSTVGYGDFTPKTVLGRFIICIFIIIGIYMFANETARLVELFDDEKMGRHSYRPARYSTHVVVVGNPSDVQLKDFIREFFHPDHDLLYSGQSLPKIVVMVEFSSPSAEVKFFQSVRSYLESKKRYRDNVILLSGSALNTDDLLRVEIETAQAVFFIPNKYARDANPEDAANVLRVLSVSKHVGFETALYPMILNSDNRTLFQATGVPPTRIIASDEIKMGLMGLSCRCNGFSTLVSNLVSSRSATIPPHAKNRPWITEYVHGASNEIYSSRLHYRFAHLTFLQAAIAIHRETDGQVLLIGMEDENHDVILNPGHRRQILQKTKVFVIAESKESFHMIEEEHVFTEITDPVTLTLLKARPNLLDRARRAQHRVERRVPKHVVAEIELRAEDSTPQEPPPEILEKEHIIVCSSAISSDDVSLGRLQKFLRPLRQPHIETPVPVVIVDPLLFDPCVWVHFAAFEHVYHVQGSPLSHTTLLRAGIHSCIAVVVLAQGDENGYDDSRAIFNTILIDSAIQDPSILALIELTDVFNNKYLDPVQETAKLMTKDDRQSYREGHNRRSKVVVSNTSTVQSTWDYFRSLQQVFLSADYSGETAEANDGDLSAMDEEINDTFFQERYVCGALFPSFVADDLLIQSFFNPPITRVVNEILSGNYCFMLYDIPARIRRQNLTFGELFEYMTEGVSGALPIGLYRAPSILNKAERPYVYTSPFSHDIVYEFDKVFVLINQTSLHQMARKIQKQLRFTLNLKKSMQK